jgi:low affinity Fe/Cu permease
MGEWVSSEMDVFTRQERRVTNSNWFSKFSTGLSTMAGKPATFVIAVVLVIVWAVSGPMFHFSDTWQLVINTSTTIVTFLMVFLIQNTQNRDTAAMQIKLDELIRALDGAHNALLDLEELNEKDLGRFRRRYEQLAEEARSALQSGGTDTDSPFIDESNDASDHDHKR